MVLGEESVLFKTMGHVKVNGLGCVEQRDNSQGSGKPFVFGDPDTICA